MQDLSKILLKKHENAVLKNHVLLNPWAINVKRARDIVMMITLVLSGMGCADRTCMKEIGYQKKCITE